MSFANEGSKKPSHQMTNRSGRKYKDNLGIDINPKRSLNFHPECYIPGTGFREGNVESSDQTAVSYHGISVPQGPSG